MASTLDAIVASIGQVLSGLSSGIGILTSNISALAGPVINNLSNNLGNLSVNLNQFTTNVLAGFSNVISSLTNNLNTFSRSFSNVAPEIGKIKESVQIISAPIKFAVSGFESLINSILDVKNGFISAAKATAFYVKAFSPVAFKFFENAIYDLHGVIGSLLLPILESFTAIVRAAADSLVPIVQKLKPAFEQIASAIISFLVPILNTFFNVLDKLTPVITRFTTILGPLASKIGEFVSLLGDELGNIAISIAESFLNLLEALMPLINGLLVLGTSVIPYISNILLAMASAVVGVTSALLMAFLPAIITAAGAVWAALSPIIIPALAIAAAFFAVVKAVQWFTSWFSKAKKDDKKEKQNLLKQTGASVGYGARESKYQSVEELSRSLIASAYSGAASIEKQMLNVEKQQLEVLQKIAGQKIQGPALGQPAPGVR